MKKTIITLMAMGSIIFPSIGKTTSYKVSSPSGEVVLDINVDDAVNYSLARNGKKVIEKAAIGMDIENKTKKSIKVKNSKKGSHNGTIKPVVPMKFSSIDDTYNYLVLDMDGNYSIEFRVMDDGVAHRFVTTFPDSINVMGETFELSVPTDAYMHLQQAGGFKTSYEESYSHKPVTEWTEEERMSTLPVLMEDDGEVVLFCETNLRDYPAFFLKGDGNGKFHAVFPKAPTKFGPDGDRSLKILEEAPYIARTAGKRTFPWRYMVVGEPKDILTNTMSARLADQPDGDFSWVVPGQASWEWWNGATPYGDDVDFEAGCNLDTYKYFIDFASKYGIKYIVMDEGWAKTTLDPFTPNPNVDLMELIRYGNEKGVGIILWLTWLSVENNFDVFEKVADWGIKGLKIDFMDRSDQWMVDYYERVAKEAAKHGLIVDMHGSFKPAGLEVTYPNLINYEGVRGMEQMGGCRPENSIYIPFMRNAVGPQDYTPGAMISMQPDCYRADRPNSASIGTRAYQLALFTVFEGGLQMLADNPTLYYRNNDCTEFITSVPTTWDETLPLVAEIGKTVAVAKRKGETWYIGAITGNNDKWNEYTFDLSFLENGDYDMTSFSDGINTPRQAMDYRKTESKVKKGDKIDVKLARNGGWTAVIKPSK